VHLIVQTLLCGAAVLALLSLLFAANSPRTLSVAVGGLALFQALHVVIMLGEVSMPHITDNAGYAVRLITHGPFRNLFWGGAILGGGILPLLLLWLAPGTYSAVALASVLALAGLFAFEWCFIMAGQSVPNS
jgi:Ni/Fe-hydrogenase subunit HybB-like protein